ncbi:MAG: PorT family protein [Marinilabiliaceae bacterium]|nr:PorT family protein [Marinilabiliaceae bacterium]
MQNKFYIILFGLFLLISIVNGQDFYAGPLLGASFSQVDGDTYAGFNKVGIKLGGFVGRQIWDDWEVQMEIMYVQKGSRHAPDIENGDYADYEIRLEYIEIPLLLRYNYKRVFFEGGLSYGSLLSSAEYDMGENFEDLYGSENIVPFQSNEFATHFGIGYCVTERLKVNMRFSYSINRIRIPFDGEIKVYEPHWGRKTGQYNDVISVALSYNLFQNYK